MKPIIEVKGLSKRYKLGVFNAKTLREEAEAFLARFGRRKAELAGGSRQSSGNSSLATSHSLQTELSSDFWALRDVSFDVQPGEVIGVIGRNGAGKSTLLKILSRITEPTSGEARIRGRVASLLEVGTGFHPELSGRENVFLNGAILGMTKQEIRNKFDEIVAFAEIEKFIDTPVKRYSSGMYVRLAFAVAAHLEPEILIVDEVLAVGDASFQKKCLGKMRDVSGRDGRTVLFVSHNMAAVQNLCSRCIVLRNGTTAFAGTAEESIDVYMNDAQNVGGKSVSLGSKPRPKDALEPGAIFEASLLNEQGQTVDSVTMGSKVSVIFKFKTALSIKDPGFGFGLHDHFGDRVTSFNNYFEGRHYDKTSSGKASWTIPDLPLLPGRYSVTLSIYSANRECIDFVEQALSFVVVESDYFGSGKYPDPTQGIFALKGSINLES